MSYEIEIIRKEQFQVSKWSGGTTIQLAIYPKNAVYSKKNFKWRLSSARVEAEESLFTSLPNFKRILMIIDGKLKLVHEGHHNIDLEPFEKDYFDGDWSTKSLGKVTDFNLMMDETCEGDIKDIHLNKDQSSRISFDDKQKYTLHTMAIYCVKGQVKLEMLSDIIVLHEGDIILVTSQDVYSPSNLKVYNEVENRADLIIVSIHY